MSDHYNTRDHRGRFTKSGAPIEPDNRVYDHVDAISGRPGEDPEMFPSFREPYSGVPGEVFGGRGVVQHDPSHGPATRALQHRRQVVINAQTGEALSDHITDVRAVHAYQGTHPTHVIAVEGPHGFEAEAAPELPPAAGHGYARSQAGRRGQLPPMGQSDQDAEIRGGHDRGR